jgi:hypothetical protein
VAAAKCIRTPVGFTKLGPSEAGKASGVILTDTAGNDWGLVVRTDGDLVILDGDDLNNAALAVATDGDVVGGQS